VLKIAAGIKWLGAVSQRHGEESAMKRMVIDKNMFERDDLRRWLAESRDHIAIVTDYAQ